MSDINNLKSENRSYPKTIDILDGSPKYDIKTRQQKIELIKQLLKEKDAKIIAHYYTHEDIQEVAELTDGNVSDSLEMQLTNEMPGEDSQTDLTTLQAMLKAQDLTIPLLFKHYSQATSIEGVSFSAFNVDPAFGDCVDAFVIADLTRLLPKKKRRYLGEEWQHRPINPASRYEKVLPTQPHSSAANS